MMTKICEKCGSPFETTRIDARFCKRKCSNSRPRGPKKNPRPCDETKRYRSKQGLDGRLTYAHRVRAESALGHPLPPRAEVHHVDGTKSSLSALVICQDRAYHMLLHRLMRIKAAGGRPFLDAICGSCHAVLPVSAFGHRSRTCHGLSTECRVCVVRSVSKSVARRRALVRSVDYDQANNTVA